MNPPTRGLLFTVLVLTMCSSSQVGFNLTYLNVPQSIFERFINESEANKHANVLSHEEITWIFSVIVVQRFVGFIVGFVLAPVLCQRFGRKWAMLHTSWVAISGLILSAISNRLHLWELLLCGRLLHSIACGVLGTCIPVFTCEISPKNIRGSVMSLHGVMTAFGATLGDIVGQSNLLGSPQYWQYEFVIMIIFQLIQLSTLPFCPDSPKDTFNRFKDLTITVQSLQYYQGSSNIDQALQDYQTEASLFETQEHEQLNIFKLLKHKPLRMPLLLGTASVLSLIFSGFQIVTSYTTETLVTLGLTNRIAGLCTLGVGVLRLFCTAVAALLVDKFGRRPLLLSSCWGCIMMMCAALSCFAWKTAQGSFCAAGYVLAVAYFLHSVFVSVGCLSVANLLPSELVPTPQRVLVMSTASTVAVVVGLVFTLLFYPMQKMVGATAWLLFIIPMLACTVFLQLKMPETKSKSVVDILKELSISPSLCPLSIKCKMENALPRITA